MSAPAAPPPLSRAHSITGHLRAAGLFLVLMVLVAGFGYPLVVTGIADVLDPGAAHGSLIYGSNGTLVGSTLVAQNLSAPWLFWERPSPTDYNMTLGAPSPPGPSDPGLRALLNETIRYIQKYGLATVNVTVPFAWAAPSASSIDPDLAPQAVLVQVPRVAEARNLSIAVVTALVNNHIVNPWLPYVGVPYVDVLSLDLALIDQYGPR